MPNKPAAAKSLRQTKKRTARNRQIMSGVEIAIRLARRAVREKTKDAADKIRTAIKTIDKAGQKGVLKRNTAARYKSRLIKFLNKTAA